MKETVSELILTRWPYGLEVQPSAKGLLLRPRLKARDTWEKSFRRSQKRADDLTEIRQMPNRFDAEEWVW
jgi:hypothetical protein